jgi:hypothetical protein
MVEGEDMAQGSAPSAIFIVPCSSSRRSLCGLWVGDMSSYEDAVSIVRKAVSRMSLARELLYEVVVTIRKETSR